MLGVHEKVYPDGSVGSYYSKCSICSQEFIGHKRDSCCGRDDCKVEETSNTPISKEDVATFNWKELHGKDVKVFVYEEDEEDGVQVGALYEPESGEFFIVHVKVLEETK